MLSTLGDIIEYTGGDIMSRPGMFSTVGDTMMSMGDIMSTPGHVQYTGVSIQSQLFSQ